MPAALTAMPMPTINSHSLISFFLSLDPTHAKQGKGQQYLPPPIG